MRSEERDYLVLSNMINKDGGHCGTAAPTRWAMGD
jgi:hypothetical protein